MLVLRFSSMRRSFSILVIVYTFVNQEAVCSNWWGKGEGEGGFELYPKIF